MRHISYFFHNDCTGCIKAARQVCLPAAQAAFHDAVLGLPFPYTLLYSSSQVRGKKQKKKQKQNKNKRLEMKNRSPPPASRVDGEEGKVFLSTEYFQRKVAFPRVSGDTLCCSALREPRDPKSSQSLLTLLRKKKNLKS